MVDLDPIGGEFDWLAEAYTYKKKRKSLNKLGKIER